MLPSYSVPLEYVAPHPPPSLADRLQILQGTPWTIHIHGMEKLLDGRANLSPLAQPDPELTHAIEVMGLFDLPYLVVGRQTPSLNVWRRYRLGQLVRLTAEEDSIEAVSGIPRSMIDMLACDEEDLTEEQLWLWPGCAGTLLQCQLWEAYKFAIMLDVRRRKRHRRTARHGQSPTRAPGVNLPDDKLLVIKALSALDAVHIGAKQPAAADSLAMNAILYPLFIVAIEVFTSDNKEWQEIVGPWFHALLEHDPFANGRQSWEIVQAIAESHREGQFVTADEVARSKQIEVALL